MDNTALLVAGVALAMSVAALLFSLHAFFRAKDARELAKDSRGRVKEQEKATQFLKADLQDLKAGAAADRRYVETALREHRPQPAAVAHEGRQVISRESEPSEPRRTAAAQAPPDRFRADEAQAFISDYNRHAADASVNEEFVARWQLQPARLQNDLIVPDSEGDLWLVRDGVGTSVCPNGKVIEKWQRVYKPAGGLRARNELEAAFDLAEGPALQLERLPRLVIVEGGWRVGERGLLRGV